MKKLLFISALALSIGAMAQNKPCKGTTKAGNPCKSVMVSKTGFCRSHDPNAIKCAAINASGKPCGMTVKVNGEKCRFHKR